MPTYEEHKSQVDKNYEFFNQKLPSLIGRYNHQFVLLKDKKIIEIFETKTDAIKAGHLKFTDAFSVQEIVDFGCYSRMGGITPEA